VWWEKNRGSELKSVAVDEFRVSSRRKNALSKWREQGAQYNESAGSKIRSKIDDMRYEIKDNRKEHTQRKKHNTSNYRN
jgi:hypothetical protein